MAGTERGRSVIEDKIRLKEAGGVALSVDHGVLQLGWDFTFDSE